MWDIEPHRAMRAGKPHPPEPRSAFRLSAEIDAAPGGSLVDCQVVEVKDLSSLGCRTSCVSSYPVGISVIISIPGLAPVGAQVRWTDGAFCGLRFDAPLHPLVVQRVVARARTQPGD